MMAEAHGSRTHRPTLDAGPTVLKTAPVTGPAAPPRRRITARPGQNHSKCTQVTRELPEWLTRAELTGLVGEMHTGRPCSGRSERRSLRAGRLGRPAVRFRGTG